MLNSGGEYLSERALHHILIVWYSRSFQRTYQPIRALEFVMDTTAFYIKTKAWMYGLYTKGFRGAHLAAAGLS